ncbi:glycosyltransferase domain-containing protein [Polyangium jinanense]|uniref:PLOD1-3-like GT domain-containing protein n=1 Tax=Polyangium jinanense TaxID=2829994 RepID=A0A9X3XC28_9BACT|nr:glycosyltransferase domain-containing protein [Polyangium jinanense]MDC3957725.1 hypothetical protein [Polyangium jinanense]MDC3987762.1 hypothetical protein [Polyangium jinanense]
MLSTPSHVDAPSEQRVAFIQRTFGTRPLLIHANGIRDAKPGWIRARDAFFAQPPRQIGPVPRLTILTCNNGHEAMGLFERSCAHLGVPCLVRGQGIFPWVNSRHKPLVIHQALQEIDTEYVFFADSRDAILVDDPHLALERFEKLFDCDLLFSGDRINWPSLKEFRQFESSLPGAKESEFRYLNSGGFIGRTAYCRTFYADAVATEPVAEMPDADQGVLKKIFSRHYPHVKLDYRCELFQNLGFVTEDPFEIVPESAPTV